MSVSFDYNESSQELSIRVDGRFDFSQHGAFREAYERGARDVRRYVIDLKDASYLDSSALGMLLLLRDFAGGNEADITISNCNDDIKKVFTISNFESLFSIA
jgi:HptB-dependent secretion and biofilm anti anti-sigma factor